MPVNPRQVTDLLGALIKIDSVSPSLVPSGPGEAKFASFGGDWLADTGAEIEIVETDPGRPNLLARLRGTGGGPTLCLVAHSDTVGFDGWPEEALVPRVDGDKIYGLGSSDDKAGCAAAMLVLRSLAEHGERLRGDLLVACVADEEGGSLGSECLANRGGIDAAIVLMPFRNDELVVEHQGFGWVDIITHGVAAHCGELEIGVDAIMHLAEVLTRLHQLDRSTFEAHPSLLNGRTVFHAGTISGGTSYSTYPGSAKLGLRVGTQPGEHLSDRLAEIDAIFAEVARTEPGFSADVVIRLTREPFVAQGHEVLQEMVGKAMSQVLGKQPKIAGMNGWTDAAVLQGAGIPTLLLGSPGGNYHVPNEWASISGVVKLCQILENVARQYLA